VTRFQAGSAAFAADMARDAFAGRLARSGRLRDDAGRNEPTHATR
jgi:hypothetical protein